MSLLNEALQEIVLGANSEFKISDHNRNQIFDLFKGIIEIDGLIDRDQEESQSHEPLKEESIDDEESAQRTQLNKQQFYPNEPNYYSYQLDNEALAQFVLQNPDKRTLFRQIAQRHSFFGNQSYLTRHSNQGKFPIFALSDFRYAPTPRVKRIYEKVMNKTLNKHRQRQQFTADYYDSLLQIFHEAQMKEFNLKEQDAFQMKEKVTLQEIESTLNRQVQVMNESKDNFYIMMQEQKKNPVQIDSQECFLDAEFYRDLEKIVMRKKVKLNGEEQDKYIIEEEQQQPQQQQQEQQYFYEEESEQQGKRDQKLLRQYDQDFVSRYFSRQDMDLGKDLKYWGGVQTNPILELPLCASQETFKVWGQCEQAGNELYLRIQDQMEIERKINEQLKDKNEQDELQRKKQQTQSEHEKQDSDAKTKLAGKQLEFKQMVNQLSYYNEEIVNFCRGNEDNFLTKPFQTYNRVEIDLNDPQFFSEKLETALHLKKNQFQSLFQPPQKLAKDHQSVLSRQIENRSLISFNKPVESSRANGEGSDAESDDDRSEKAEQNFVIEYSQQQIMIPNKKEEQIQNELMFVIQNHQKRRIPPAPLHHSVLAETFQINNFSQDLEKHKLYNRSNIYDILSGDQLKPWSIALLATPQQQASQEKGILEEYPEKLNSQEYYKTLDKLSLMKGNFLLFEYLEQRPLILNNAGMCIKATRYVYDYRILQTYFKNLNIDEEKSSALDDFKNLIVERLGKFGTIQFLQKHEPVPTQGQLTDERFIGMSVIENDLYRAPVFKQKLPETDFLLVRKASETPGQYYYALRPIDYIYFVGQIEPKIEIYTPHSRPLGTFLKNCLKTYIKKQFKQNRYIIIDQLEETFPKQSHQNIRNALKECNGVVDISNQKFWYFQQLTNDDANILNKFDITANQVCLYESMLHSSYLLSKFGLRELKNSDKMKKTLQVFLQRHPNDYRSWVIARRIEDELNMTAWSLSASFLHSANQTGRMLLYGIGDPSGGHGALNYIKKPLKARGEKEAKAVMEKKPAIMGTDADLRKLHVLDIRDILLKLGRTVDQVANLKRWRMIDQVARMTLMASNPDEADSPQVILFKKNLELLTPQQRHQLNVIDKFAKNQRLTTKMQKDQYQKELNSQINLQVYNMSLTNAPSDIKKLRQRRKLQHDEKLKDLEVTQSELEPFILYDYEDYMVHLDAYLKKEEKIWLDKKRKKGLL